jgi:hypothetical protein
VSSQSRELTSRPRLGRNGPEAIFPIERRQPETICEHPPAMPRFEADAGGRK